MLRLPARTGKKMQEGDTVPGETQQGWEWVPLRATPQNVPSSPFLKRRMSVCGVRIRVFDNDPWGIGMYPDGRMVFGLMASDAVNPKDVGIFLAGHKRFISASSNGLSLVHDAAAQTACAQEVLSRIYAHPQGAAMPSRFFETLFRLIMITLAHCGTKDVDVNVSLFWTRLTQWERPIARVYIVDDVTFE
jgi:hypothetical protein